MPDCQHENFEFDLNVVTVEPDTNGNYPRGYTMLELKVSCSDCGVPFAFKGLPGGMSPSRPMVSPFGEELRAPIEPLVLPAGVQAN